MRTPVAAVAAALLVVGLAGCLQFEDLDDLPAIPGPPMPDDRYAGHTVSLLLFGDQGTQMQDQYDTAQAMKKVCDEEDCDFAITLGDNIYTVGPLVGTSDPQFVLGFEEPYADFAMPFYMTLGNHDNGGSGHIVVHGDYEVAYTYSDESSGKWQMPSRYYNQTFNDGFLEIWSVDGDTLTAGDSVGGIRLGPDVIYDRQPQIHWMQESISGSDAYWKIVFGHYQYSTEGYKGDGDPLFKDALEQFMCDQVQFYFYGHQHQLRWTEPIDGCERTEHINSGAGARSTHEPTPEPELGIDQYFTYVDGAGFWHIQFEGDTMTGTAYGVSPEDPTEPVELYQRTVTRAELGWDQQLLLPELEQA